VALCLVPRAGASIDEPRLLELLREKLAAYKVPKHLLVFSEQEIPRTGTEKVRLGVLRDLVLGRLGSRLLER
jgi:fatty-acyl-CoA synthase